MNFTKVSSTFWVVECPVSDFKITMLNDNKKVSGLKNFANLSYFGGFDEKTPKAHFTLPITHLVCDLELDTSVAKHYWCDYYMRQRGKCTGSHACFDQGNWSYMSEAFYGKAISTLVVKNGVANIEDLVHVDPSMTYAVSGTPLMMKGNDIKFNPYVKSQGWDGSTLYATYHTILATKAANATSVLIIGIKTTTGNMVSSGEIYKKLKNIGVYSAIKCDGGGSFVMDVNGSRLQTSENRQINAIVKFGSSSGSSSTTPTSGGSTTTTYTGKGTTTANLNMRKGPGSSYDVLTTIPKGSTVSIDTSYSNNSWYHVSYGGQTGYCAKQYISTSSASSGSNTQPSTNTGKLAPKNPYTVPTHTLTKGNGYKAETKWLQWMLWKLGILTDTEASAVDGSFGPGTMDAVKRWQKAYGLTPDGSFGPASLAKMKTL